MSSIAVIGAGGIGTVLAAAFADAGHEVVACTRPVPGPLVLERGGSVHELKVRMVTDPAAATPAEWVLLCTKAHDTRAAAPWLARTCVAGTTVVVCQNGIGHLGRVAGLVGPATPLPALVYIAAERVGPARVRHHRGTLIVVPAGEPADRLAGLAPAGIEVRGEPDFVTASWRKLLTNVAANPITALTLRRMSVLGDPEVRELATALLTEAVAVGRAAGADLGPDDVTRILAFYSELGPEDGTSMLYDRLAGRPTEYELFNGAVTALGRRHGVPTPANQAVYALLRAGEQAQARGGHH
ncbi:2-dehydropantoate 2-reductase [Thermocatellispora tengchongensis]|uniref:2-dehydropantoate 2-reductase n=1 Tax=Thermocatellispora tengchongensis TaxID=1073253 RepID=A0A840PFQ0_9ACTN|nr:2-dehydropantoate 2-reductase [Thermocatellispora tengchongensis]MBB5137819.1 2-dehydropantoate 2-reductase [Thermocatellispora tengchongensis]